MKSAKRVLICVFLLSLIGLPPSIPGSGLLPTPFAVTDGTAWAATGGDNDYGPEDKTPSVSDPFEGLNRFSFKFNDRLYFYGLKPVAIVYSAYFPEGFRLCIRNAFYNIAFPVRVVNNALQGKFDRSGIEITRFLVNTTLGFAGFWDVAARNFNMKTYDEDFGQTLGYYGAPPGPHVHLPFLGPSNARDVFGLAADYFLNPIHWILYCMDAPDIYPSAAITGGKTINAVSLRIGEYEDFKKSALDPYVSMRDAYTQYRDEEIKR